MYTSVEEIPKKTSFHAQKLASISVKNYLHRFATHSECHEDVFIYTLIYLDRIGDNFEEFNLDSFNVLRIILMAMVAAVKFYDDSYFKNHYYAKIGGLSLEEFNKLETEFLHEYMNYRLYVDIDTYKSCFDDLIKLKETKHSEKDGLQ